MPLDKYRETNRANWDSRVEHHVASDIYGLHRFIDDPAAIGEVVRFDSTKFGDISGKKLIHLQCHIGSDTIGLARLGADVTGIDLSEKSIEAARRLSEDSGTPARYYVAELYDTVEVVGEKFDFVYTGVGAICWLPDIKGWAKVVSDLLEPGGTFYMREASPVVWAIDYEREDDLLVLRYSYFETEKPDYWEDEETYAGEGKISSPGEYVWNHGMAETIQALIDAGLTIDQVEEYDFLEWEAGPVSELGEDGLYRLPEGRERMPLMWSVMATKAG